MNNYKYKILWLDDDFEPVSSETNIDEKDTRKTFQDDVDMASDYGIEVEGVWNYEMFREQENNLKSFQAVVFDLKGMEKEGDVSDWVMPDALEIIKQKLPVFVYSANVLSEKFKLTLRNIQKEGRCFSKAMGVTPLYEKIIEVVDANLHYYRGHEECLWLFANKYLSTANRDKMDELMRKYYAKEKTYAPYNIMRQILEDMLNSLVNVGLIDSTIQENGEKMKYLYRLHRRNGDGTNNRGGTQGDYTNSGVSYSDCPKDIKYVLHYLWDIANSHSHFSSGSDPLEQEEYLFEIQQSVYFGFFVAMKWFYRYMKKKGY